MRGINRVFGPAVALIIFSLTAAVSIANAFPGQTTRVSVDSAGVPANAGATNGVLSADGRYVVFQSSATNLVGGLRGLSGAREISDDGRYVAFTSFATNLTSGSNNGRQQIYVKDMTTSAVVRASVNEATGEAGDRTSQTPAISGNGQVVAFRSESTNFSPLSTSGVTPEIFARDLVSGTTTLESFGVAINGSCATNQVLSLVG